MTLKLKVGLLQLTSKGLDQKKNMVKGEEFCRIAKRMDVDIALFPEMWNIGYNLIDPKEEKAKEKLLQYAIERDSWFTGYYRKLASKLEIGIGITYLEKEDGELKNSFSLINKKGAVILKYSKVHTCQFSKEALLTPGEDFYVAPMKIKGGEVNIGAMICFDREFPESGRILMLKGAEIILIPNCCDMDNNRISQLRTRAFENMVGVALANYSEPRTNGHSAAFSPVSFNENGESVDNLIIQAGREEGVYTAIFDIEKLRVYRRREVWGNAYRKPEKYSLLVSEEVKEPFKREF